MSKWIKVSDRLPRYDTSVLAVRAGNVCNMGMCPNGLWYTDGYGIEVKKYYDDITHWMPLPAAPEEL